MRTLVFCVLSLAQATFFEAQMDVQDPLNSVREDARHAQASVHAIQALASQLNPTDNVRGGAVAAIPAFAALEKVSKILSIAGMFFSFVELFLPSEHDEVMGQLKRISSKITQLRGDMSFYFSKVIEAQRMYTCFAQMAFHENKIRTAWDKLVLMNEHQHDQNINTYKFSFMDTCSGAQCADAVDGILSAIDGDPSFMQCDMLSILYEGNVTGDYWVGMRDQVAMKAGYLTTLVAMGIIVESTYQTMATNDPQAWKVSQMHFTDRLESAIAHIMHYDTKCKNSLIQNTNTNVQRIVHEHPQIRNKALQKKVLEMSQKMDQSLISQVTVYGTTRGNDNHFHACSKCMQITNLNHKFNINVAYLESSKGKPFAKAIQSSAPEDAAKRYHKAHQIAYQASHAECYTGFSVVKTKSGYQTSGELMAKHFVHFDPKSHGFTLLFWSQEHMPCVRVQNPKEVEKGAEIQIYHEWPDERI